MKRNIGEIRFSFDVCTMYIFENHSKGHMYGNHNQDRFFQQTKWASNIFKQFH